MKSTEKTESEFLDPHAGVKRNAAELDQKNRELAIETAVNRVYARTMAMQSSDELSETSDLFFEQFKNLSQIGERISIGIFDEAENVRELYSTFHGAQPKDVAHGDLVGPMVLKKIHAARKKERKSILIDLKAEKLDEYNAYRKKLSNLTYTGKRRVIHVALFSTGVLTFSSPKPHAQRTIHLLERFANVFEGAYTRFLDLQKAEAQAREVMIEASLEKVRSRALDMHKSEELRDVVNMLLGEFENLKVVFHVIAIHLKMDESRDPYLWLSTPDGIYGDILHLPYMDMRIYREAHKAWSTGKLALTLLKSETRKFFEEYFKVKQVPQERRVATQHVEVIDIVGSYHTHTGLFLMRYTKGVYSEEEKNITKRFAKVFEQTYTRFLDLQKAESQARELQIEVALERVRSRTMAMQSSDELSDTAVVLFRQLIHLGIQPNRLYIGIVNEDKEHIEMWATDEDGSKISSKKVFDATGNKSIANMYKAWKSEKKFLTFTMKGKELADYLKYVRDELSLSVTDSRKQKKRFHTMGFFSKGLVGSASPDEQPPSTTRLLERFAAVFNLTFTRFNDLKIAEANAVQAQEDLVKLQKAKLKAENALTELKAAQSQLIQSEKMASLGELAAGIAHEIQNPLNFVNNFSELNRELLDEMKVSLNLGHSGEALSVAEDIVSNLDKIIHHGKRADGIVKGMLQHSQTATGVREPTDINVLVDEYLRLAYHGMRAKDKSFDVSIKKEFDPNIGLVDVVAQDIGRVVLNLINNAFYACAERSRNAIKSKKSQKNTKYKPEVELCSAKVGDTIELSVRDNGIGIPENAIRKIFQPFYTTKPTGQGTGLGLSLSYDIMKAQGGDLSLMSDLKKGTEFKVVIPMSKSV